LQVSVPQQSPELLHALPEVRHEPSTQVCVRESQVRMSQQSPLMWQDSLRPWHGPLRSGGSGAGEPGMLQPQAKAAARTAVKSPRCRRIKIV
jgi:hypothetical protein